MEFFKIFSFLWKSLQISVTPFSAHFISDHRISDQKVRTVMVRAIVRVRVRVMVRLGSAVVRNAAGRKVGNRDFTSKEPSTTPDGYGTLER